MSVYIYNNYFIKQQHNLYKLNAFKINKAFIGNILIMNSTGKFVIEK